MQTNGVWAYLHCWIMEVDLASLVEAVSKGEQCSVHKHGGAGQGRGWGAAGGNYGVHFLPTPSTLALTPQGKAFVFC